MAQSMITFVTVIAPGLIGGADLPAQQRIAVSYPGIAGYNIPFGVALDSGEFKRKGTGCRPVTKLKMFI